ncbi:Phosphatidylinositol 4-kinase type 2-beta [Agyrium rufum]|nr:Phosphatidylinositol 4-kinase type 2-beta [Agyrium rufum]
MSSVFWLVTTLLLGVCSAIPSPEPTSPPSAIIQARAACNEDNCLRALRNQITAASAFCNTYTSATTNTASTGFPTFVPTTCGPSRVSSACSCAVTKGPCATNAPTQVVQLPGFEKDGTAPSFQPTNFDGPWNATDTASRIFFVEGDSYEGTHFFHTWGFDDDQTGRLVGVNGTTTLFQTISLCPASTYSFSFYVGFVGDVGYQSNPGYLYNTTVTVYLGDIVILPTQLTCTDATQCNLPTNPPDPEGGYRHVVAPALITPPANGMAVLKFVIVRASTGPGGPPLQDTLLDFVTLTKVS